MGISSVKWYTKDSGIARMLTMMRRERHFGGFIGVWEKSR
jgi:hypothetical protein